MIGGIPMGRPAHPKEIAELADLVVRSLLPQRELVDLNEIIREMFVLLRPRTLDDLGRPSPVFQNSACCFERLIHRGLVALKPPDAGSAVILGRSRDSSGRMAIEYWFASPAGVYEPHAQYYGGPCRTLLVNLQLKRSWAKVVRC